MSKSDPVFVHITYENSPDDDSGKAILEEVKSALKSLGIELKHTIPHRALTPDKPPSSVVAYGTPLPDAIELIYLAGQFIAIGVATRTGEIIVDAIKNAVKKSKSPKEIEVVRSEPGTAPHIEVRIEKIQIIIEWDDKPPEESAEGQPPR